MRTPRERSDEATIRRAGRDDFAKIRELLAQEMPENAKCDAELMEWQYVGNPFGEAVSWVAEVDGRVVCHHATLPVRMRVHDRMTRGGLQVDVATATPFQGRGLFTRVLGRALAHSREHGIEAGLSFRPRSSMLPRASAQVLTRMSRLVLPLDASWLANRLRVPKSVVRLAVPDTTAGADDVDVADSTPDDIGELETGLASRMGSGVIRDRAWWAWRFDGHPHQPYRVFTRRRGGKLDAAGVVRIVGSGARRFGYVLELLAIDAAAARSLVAAIGECARDDAVSLLFLVPGGGYGEATAKAAGFRAVPRILDRNPEHLNVRDIAGLGIRSGGWHATWADEDQL